MTDLTPEEEKKAEPAKRRNKVAEERDELIAVNQEFFEETERLKAELAEARALAAKSIPASFTKYNESQDHDIGDDKALAFDQNNITPPVFDVIDSPISKDRLDYEKFMTDIVNIRIDGSSDSKFIKVFSVGVNGMEQVFKAGETYNVPRYFVEGLVRAKKTEYDNQEFTDAKGVSGYRYDPTTNLRYNFSVISDPNPRGADWLKAVLRQP